MNRNKILEAAKRRKNDEFYTRREDIVSELQHYWQHLRNKVVYCNCDDPLTSQFTAYFRDHFAELGLRKLISTCYRTTTLFERQPALIQIVDSRGTHTGTLRGDGDFRSPECIELMEQADIVVTNPPFSLFREYISLLTQYRKQYLVVGNLNAIKYKCFFPMLHDGDVWLGVSLDLRWFGGRDGGSAEAKGVWYTNMDHGYRPPPIDLTERYCPEKHPRYDNYDAINVDRTCDIPVDYDGVMGVPISYLVKYCPEQFDLLGVTDGSPPMRTKIYPPQTQVDNINKRQRVNKMNYLPALRISDPSDLDTYYIVDGQYYRSLFARLLIQRKNK